MISTSLKKNLFKKGTSSVVFVHTVFVSHLKLCFEGCSFKPTLLTVFIMDGYYTLSNAFSAFIKMIIWWFFSFFLLMWCKALIDLPMMNHLCIPGINPLIMVKDFHVLLEFSLQIFFFFWGFLQLCSLERLTCEGASLRVHSYGMSYLLAKGKNLPRTRPGSSVSSLITVSPSIGARSLLHAHVENWVAER